MENSKSIVKTINGLLNSAGTRLEGLKLLNHNLTEFSDENFTDSCVNWMQNCCKSGGSFKESDLTVQILSKLFKISANYSELHKPVSFFITNRFFDHFFKYFVNSVYGWECAKNCFLYYKGPCGPSQESIEKVLLDKMKKNEKIPKVVSDCVALLPSLGGGGNEGLNYKENWRKQFVKYIHLCHSILNDLFADIEELQRYNTGNDAYETNEKHPSAEYLKNILCNHLSILSSMLLISYPTQKCIPLNLLMELLCRGLSINPSSLDKSETTALLSLSKVLPEIQRTVLETLNALIAVCGSQSLPYSYLICKLIKQTLDWTKSESRVYGRVDNYETVRIAAYNTICSWLVAAKSGGNMESIANSIINHAISDIEFKMAVTLLKEAKGSKEKGGNDTKHSSRCRMDSQANSCLCYSALRALQCLLRFSGVFIKSEDHKLLQETVVKLLVDIYKSIPSEVKVPFTVSKCRKELFSVLLELVNQPSPKFPPPTHFALRLFKAGENDQCPEVSQFCSSSLNALTVIIHRQFANGPCLPMETGPKTNSNSVVWRRESIHMNGTAENEPTKEIESSDNDTMEIHEDMNAEKEELVEERLLSNTPEKRELYEGREGKANGSKPNAPSPKKLSTPVTISPEKHLLKENERNHEVLEIASAEEMVYINKGDKASPKKNKSTTDSHSCEEENGSDSSQIKECHEEPKSKKYKVSNDETIPSPQSNVNVKEVTLENENEPRCESSLAGNSEAFDRRDSNEEVTPPKKTSFSEKSEKQNSDESPSEKSVTPDLSECGEYLDYKKRYFLRSKTGNGTEETLKRTDSVDSLGQTPTRHLGKNTPTSNARRPRTRALSKLETCDNETDTPKKTDEDIFKVFNSTIKD